MSGDCSTKVLITWDAGPATYLNISRSSVPAPSPLDLFSCLVGVQMSGDVTINLLHQLISYSVRHQQLQVFDLPVSSKILAINYPTYQLKIVPLGTVGFGGRAVGPQFLYPRFCSACLEPFQNRRNVFIGCLHFRQVINGPAQPTTAVRLGCWAPGGRLTVAASDVIPPYGRLSRCGIAPGGQDHPRRPPHSVLIAHG